MSDYSNATAGTDRSSVVVAVKSSGATGGSTTSPPNMASRRSSSTTSFGASQDTVSVRADSAMASQAHTPASSSARPSHHDGERMHTTFQHDDVHDDHPDSDGHSGRPASGDPNRNHHHRFGGLSSRMLACITLTLYFLVLAAGVTITGILGGSVITAADTEAATHLTVATASKLAARVGRINSATAQARTLAQAVQPLPSLAGGAADAGARAIVGAGAFAANALAALWGACSVDPTNQCNSASALSFSILNSTTLATAGAVLHEATAVVPSQPGQQEWVTSRRALLFVAEPTTTSPMLLLESTNSTAAAGPLTTVGAVATAALAAVDPIAFGNSQLTSALKSSSWLAAATASAPTPTTPQQAPLLLYHSDSSTLRAAINVPLRTVDGSTVTAVVSAAVGFDPSADVDNVLEYGRVCQLFLSGTTVRSLGCLPGSNSAEADAAAILPTTPTTLATGSRMQLLALLAQQQQASFQSSKSKGRFTFVQAYDDAVLSFASVRVIGFSPIAAVTFLSADGSTTPGTLWAAVVVTKAESTGLQQNTFFQAALVVLAFIIASTVIFYVCVYMVYVRHINDLTVRIAQVATLDFNSIPDYTAPGDEDAAGGIAEPDAPPSPSQQRDLECKAVLSDIQQLYGEFFRVATALRAVVPFLPDDFVAQCKDGTTFDRVASTLSNGGRALRVGAQHDAAERRGSSSVVDFGADLASEGTDEDDMTPENRSPGRISEALSSISDIDLEHLDDHTLDLIELTPRGQHGSARSAASRQPRIFGVGASSSTGGGGHGGSSAAANQQQQPSRPPSMAESGLTATSRTTTSSDMTRIAGHTSVTAPPPETATTQSKGAANGTTTAKGSTGGKHPAAKHLQSNVKPNPNVQHHAARRGYSNEVQSLTAVMVSFELYFRTKARGSKTLIADITREFVVSVLTSVAARKGQVTHMTSTTVLAEWVHQDAEQRACTAALEAVRAIAAAAARKENEWRGYYRVCAGIDAGVVAYGALGTSVKKSIICDGPAVVRSALLASCGVRNHCSVIISDAVRRATSMFVESRPVDALAFPKGVRLSGKVPIETIHQLLHIDLGNDDEEWMYTLQRKEAQGTKAAAGETPFSQGYAAFIAGELIEARERWTVALEVARKAGFDDSYLTKKIDLLAGVRPSDMAPTEDIIEEDVDDEMQRWASSSRIVGTFRRQRTTSSNVVQASSTNSSSRPPSSPQNRVTQHASLRSGDSASNAFGAAADTSVNQKQQCRMLVSFFKPIRSGARPYFRSAAVLGAEGLPFE